MPGRHNGLNAAAAFAAALKLGIAADEAADAFKTFKAPPRRLEWQAVGPYIIYNDVAMNEASYHAVLRSVRDLRPEQVVVVCALRGNRGAAVNARIARILAAWQPELRFAPLIVSESRSDLREYAVDYTVRPEEIVAFSEEALMGGLRLSRHEELPSAIAEAVERLRPGGVLLLLGTFGMDRGPAVAKELLRQRVGLPAAPKQGYLEPHEADY
jgi:UDP-N-acetylmuramoyl-L-alanyl-D-glutamate--2,6-diaminopimelate ligase